MKIQTQRETFAYRLAASVAEDLLTKLKGEFDTWAVDYAGPSQDVFGDRWNRGPIGEWWNVERFLEDNYPAAYRGLGTGMEDAGGLLDKAPGEEVSWLKNYETMHDTVEDIADYETGPDAVAQHGYDPKATAAAMLLLHNRSHPLRSDLEGADMERLHQIAQGRSKQQRAYEQAKVAFYLYADMNVSTGDPGSGGSSSANSAQMMVNQVYNDQAQSLLSQADGRDYNFGGSGQGSDVVPGGDPLSYDCTGLIGDVKTIYEGGDPNGSYATDATGTRFNTTSDMMGAGFEPGAKPGALNIGINPNPGEAGHAVGQLPSGEKFESSGSDGVEYGSDARSITDRSLSQQYHLPNSELPNTSSPTTTETMLGGGVK